MSSRLLYYCCRYYFKHIENTRPTLYNRLFNVSRRHTFTTVSSPASVQTTMDEKPTTTTSNMPSTGASSMKQTQSSSRNVISSAASSSSDDTQYSTSKSRNTSASTSIPAATLSTIQRVTSSQSIHYTPSSSTHSDNLRSTDVFTSNTTQDNFTTLAQLPSTNYTRSRTKYLTSSSLTAITEATIKNEQPYIVANKSAKFSLRSTGLLTLGLWCYVISTV